MYQRLSWKESFWEKNRIKIIFLLLIVVVFPIRVDGFVTESYTEKEETSVRELKESIDCEFKLSKASTFEEVYTDLGDTLRVTVEIASSIDIDLMIQSSEKVEIKKTDNFFDYNITVNGPSLVIRILNPTLPLIGKDAELSGKIDVFHEYTTIETVTKTREVPSKVWRIWWTSYIS
jgi:hypothetical protein